jgi:hypothetical protein
MFELARAKHWKWTGFRRVSGGFPKGELLERRGRLRAALAPGLAQRLQSRTDTPTLVLYAGAGRNVG